ncbi:MAG TPA: glycosyl hydrolase [Candidatus Baltobacteraceae bacterium]|nr:glycosyl hydrolase [Candidatus Baltobacteraceae bacterium]
MGRYWAARLALFAFALILPACGIGGSSAGVSGLPGGAVVPAFTQASAFQPSAKIPIPPSGHAYFAAYVNLSNCEGCLQQIEDDTESLEKTVGRKFAIHNHYYDFPDVNSTHLRGDPGIQADLARGRYPMISWRCSVTLHAVINGDEDSIIQNAARALKGLNTPVMLRFCWEFNGGPWMCTASPCPNHFAPKLFDPSYSTVQKGREFQQAWQHIYKIFQSQAATNVSFYYCPDGSPTQGKDRIIYAYPGAAYVDWKGFDAYDTHSIGLYNTYLRHYGTMTKYLKDGVPLMIGETNERFKNGSPWTQEQYYKDEVSHIPSTFPAIKAVSLFVGINPNTGDDWEPDASGLLQMPIWGRSSTFHF